MTEDGLQPRARQTQPADGAGCASGRDVRDLVWVLPWLVFLAFPAADIALGGYGRTRVALASIALAAFTYLYVWLVWWDGFVKPRHPGGWRLALLGLLAALTVVLTLAYGANWAGLFIYLSVAGAATLPMRYRYTVAWVGAVTAVLVAIGLLRQYELWAAILVFLTFMIGLGVAGSRRTEALVTQLRDAQEELARLAVSEERLRFARDLHDLLGHSLSLIVLKSEVARRVLERDPETAAREVGEIEAAARRSLAEVREAVSGYRAQSLTDELDGARASLSSAGVEPVVRVSGTPLPAEADTLFGWAVREGVTNIVRHSGAGRCEIVVRRTGDLAELEIRDDGPGAAPANGWGSGLQGLAERLAAAGGWLRATPRPGGGFRMAASLPLEAPPDGAAPPPPTSEPRESGRGRETAAREVAPGREQAAGPSS